MSALATRSKLHFAYRRAGPSKGMIGLACGLRLGSRTEEPREVTCRRCIVWLARQGMI